MYYLFCPEIPRKREQLVTIEPSDLASAEREVETVLQDCGWEVFEKATHGAETTYYIRKGREKGKIIVRKEYDSVKIFAERL